MRIASLLPSATEMAFLLGAGADIVGVSHECDFPAESRAKPVLTTSSHGRPAGAAAALSPFAIDEAALRAAAPDLILTQDLCAACAVELGQVEEAAERLLGRRARLVALAGTTLAGVWNDLLRIGRAVGRAERAEAAVRQLEGSLSDLAVRTAGMPQRPKVVSIEWTEPVWLAGLWTEELVAAAGGIALGPARGEKGRPCAVEELARLDPDVVLVKPCGLRLPAALAAARALLPKLPPEWPALRDGRVFAADGNAFFNRPGPRLVESAEILAACLHGDDGGMWARRHEASFARILP